MVEEHAEPGGLRRYLPPWWTLSFPLVADAGFAAWRAANADDAATAFASNLIWPGAAVFGVVLVMVLLGWALDID